MCLKKYDVSIPILHFLNSQVQNLFYQGHLIVFVSLRLNFACYVANLVSAHLEGL
uniref:Uncharacterized protein n=1 Tax=Rhizophora mucronata TaxID=61149 RepID=A0A2P2L7G9_RHIMU